MRMLSAKQVPDQAQENTERWFECGMVVRLWLLAENIAAAFQ